MNNVLVSTSSADLQSRVHDASGGRSIAVSADEPPANPAGLLALTGHTSLPDVVVLDATRNAELALGLAAAFDRELPGTFVVLIGDPEVLAIAALRVGVRDVLPPDADVATLRAAIDRAGEVARQRRATPAGAVPLLSAPAAPGRVVTVLSPKGGAGKTTVSTNLAVGLAQVAPESTVLVDLDVQFGDVATALGLDPEYTLEDVISGSALRDPIAMKTHLTRHASGLSVVCAPDNPVVADAVSAEQVGALVAALSSQFRYVVIDTAAGLEPRTLAALDHTTDPVLLTTFDVVGARGLRKEVATLRELGMLSNARQIVLNFADPRSGLSVSDVEATVRSPIDHVLPHSKAVTASLNTGIPLIVQHPRDPVARQLRRMAEQFSGAPSQPVKAWGRRSG